MRAYSMDLRERVLRESDAGMKAAAGAVKYHVSATRSPPRACRRDVCTCH